MKNMTPEIVYSQLQDALCKETPIPHADWGMFIEKTKIDHFTENEVLVEPGQLSTHSYFIVKGLMMCYQPREPKHAIMWFRAENEHAFTIDKMKLRDPARQNEERLVALEDSIVVSISHDDLLALEDSNPRVFNMMWHYFLRTAITFGDLSRRDMKDPEYSYGFVQKIVTFDLNRVPAAYLALYLGTSVKRIKEIRNAVQQ